MHRPNPALPTALVLSLLLAACGRGGGPAAAGPDANPVAPASYRERPIEDDVFYFVLPDRFANGDPDNDLGAPQGVSHGGLDPTHKGFFHGGDLRGLEQQLDYLEGLGITALWLTPLLRNQAVQGDSAAYHGYWIVDFTEVDPHWGGDADLRALIDAAHARDMKVFFDIITNHTADVIRYRECHDARGAFRGAGRSCRYRSRAGTTAGDGYTPFVPEHLRGVKRPAWLNDPAWYNNQGDSTWEGESVVTGDFAGLDDIDTTSPLVAERFVGIYRDLIDRFQPDGLRIDTVKHVDLAFWQRFVPPILAHARANGIPQFTVFGEVYNFDPTELAVYTRHGRFPAVLDFALQGALRSVLADGAPAQRLADVLAEDDWYNRSSAGAAASMTFTGNHDMGRIGHFLDHGSLGGSLDDAAKLQRSALAHSVLFLARGVPVVYYGDEQGFTGDGNDQDAREDMFPSLVASYNDNRLLGTAATTADANFDRQHPLYRHIAGLAAVYRDSPALRRGDQVLRQHDGDSNTLVLSRLLDGSDRDTLVAFNFGSEASRVTLPAWSRRYRLRYGDAVEPQVHDGELELRLPPLSASVFVGDTALPRTPPPRLDASARMATRLGQRFLVVDYQLADGPAARQNGPLRLRTRWNDAAGSDSVVSDSAAPWRAVFPLRGPANPDRVTLEITLDNYGGDLATIERTLPLAR